MLRARGDRELRRLVAELATMTVEDIDGVLGELDSPQRHKVKALLASYAGVDEAPARSRPAKPHPVAAPPRVVGLSPWLAMRLKQGGRPDVGGGPGGGRRGQAARPDRGPLVAMTPAALGALRASAAALSQAQAEAKADGNLASVLVARALGVLPGRRLAP